MTAHLHPNRKFVGRYTSGNRGYVEVYVNDKFAYRLADPVPRVDAAAAATFEWGDVSDRAVALSSALLTDVIGAERAERLCDAFVTSTVRRLPTTQWELSAEVIQSWADWADEAPEGFFVQKLNSLVLRIPDPMDFKIVQLAHEPEPLAHARFAHLLSALGVEVGTCVEFSTAAYGRVLGWVTSPIRTTVDPVLTSLTLMNFEILNKRRPSTKQDDAADALQFALGGVISKTPQVFDAIVLSPPYNLARRS